MLWKRFLNIIQFLEQLCNMKKHRDIKLVLTEGRRNYLVSEPNYHVTKFFTGSLLVLKTKTIEKLMSKPVYLGLAILTLSNINMYEFCMIT